MKSRFRIFTLALFLMAAPLLRAQETIELFKGDWAAALQAAKAQNKYILLDCYTDWCGWCKVMDKKTFTDPSVAEFIKENFIVVKKEMEKDPDGRKLSMKYHVGSFPSFLFFTPEGKLVSISHGYQPPEDYRVTMKNALEPGMQVDYPGYTATGLDVAYPDFYTNVFGDKKGKTPDEKTVVNFLDKQESKISEVSWAVLWRFRFMANCADLILANAGDLKRLYGQGEVEDAITDVIFSRASEANKNGDAGQLDVVMGLVDKYLSKDQETIKNGLQMNFYKAGKNWRAYADLEQKNITKAGEKNISGEINEIAWTLYEQCDDKGVLNQAIGWMKNVCEKNPEYMFLDTYASLLYKVGNYKEARAQAELAIDAGKRSGEDVKSTQSLLEQIKMK